MPNSSPVHGEPALGGGVGVGAWAPPDDGEGMLVESVTDMPGAGDGARSDVVGLGSGQVSLVSAGAGVVLFETSAGRGAVHDAYMGLSGASAEPGDAYGLQDAAVPVAGSGGGAGAHPGPATSVITNRRRQDARRRARRSSQQAQSRPP